MREVTSVVSDRPTITVALPSGWARGSLAGIEAALLGWLFPMAIGMSAFWASADNQWMKNVDWSAAIQSGTAYWILSLGVPTYIGALHVSLIPLGWTLCQIVLLRLLLLNVRRYSIGSVWFAPVFFVLTTTVIVGAINPDSDWWWALLGGFIVSLLGASWTYLAATMKKVVSKAGIFIRGSLRLGAVWTLVLLGLTAVVTLWVRLANPLPNQLLAEQLGSEGIDGFFISILQIGYVPNLIIWTLAVAFSVPVYWVSRQPLSPELTDKTIFPAVTSVALTPVLSVWIMVLLAAVAALVYTWMYRKLSLVKALSQVLIANLVVLAAMALLTWLSQGGLGAGELGRLGADVWPLTLMLALTFTLPTLLIVLLLNAQFDAAWVRLWRYLQNKVRAIKNKDNVDLKNKKGEVADAAEGSSAKNKSKEDGVATEVIGVEAPTEVVESEEIASKTRYGDND